MSPDDQIRVVRFGSKHLSPVSPIACPLTSLKGLFYFIYAYVHIVQVPLRLEKGIKGHQIP